ncbi:hypothetical protein NP233_g2196 [Leucocoprinus birnbaumii]|uniref:NAD(P)-binding protein n=1 Tax=Leucocoprinus birnbaumii TaxID=56174 RepID=A0AAD5VYQ3_9AGAR|nr:hypothetical protein NP233_g2196 [Leucocoprinus birnbaumii]
MALRVALVTGASRGIGEAIARRLAHDGFDVALNDLPSRLSALESLHREITRGGRRVYIHTADVSQDSEVESMVKETVKNLGGLNVVSPNSTSSQNYTQITISACAQKMVANAGIARFTPSEALGTVEVWDHVMSVNARGVYLCYKHAAEAMIAQGRGGRIIGAASVVSKQGMAFATAYSASKFAVRGLTQSAAQELGKYGITVNAYAPGPIRTPMLQDLGLDPAAIQALSRREAGKTVVGRPGKPEEIAHIVSYLASDGSAFTTGQTISVNGGQFFD